MTTQNDTVERWGFVDYAKCKCGAPRTADRSSCLVCWNPCEWCECGTERDQDTAPIDLGRFDPMGNPRG